MNLITITTFLPLAGAALLLLAPILGLIALLIRLDSDGRRYYRKRVMAGDSKTEALRCLKRRLARVVFRTLKSHLQPATGLQPAAA